MKTQNIKKENIQMPNLTRAALIKYELVKRGIKQEDVAEALGITPSAIVRFMKGFSKSKRFDLWIRENLGLVFKKED